MTDLNVLPARIDASLGPPKTDPGWAVDILRQLRLVPEWETAADWIVELAAAVGVHTGAEWNSLRGLVSGDTLDWHEHWLEEVVGDMHRWETSLTAPAVLGNLRGGLSFPLDSVGGIDFRLKGTNFARGQTPYVRARYMLDGDPGTFFSARFDDAAGNEGWGVKFLTAGKAIKGYTRTGGADTDVAVSTWVSGTEVAVAFYVLAHTLYVVVGGGAPVACGTVPAGNTRLRFWADDSGAAGKVCQVFNARIMANWSV